MFPKVRAKHPSAKLYVVGGSRSLHKQELSPELARLRRQADELGLADSVVFLGPKPQESLRDYYSAADVCVVPSYYEPFGIVPLEAMACGTPVVASKTGGLMYTVEDGKTGFLAAVADPDDFANKTLAALKRGKASFTPACLERVRMHFGWPDIAQQYAAHYRSLIGS
jgi:glycosyltransferase involved in cell wall biosynthesis